MKMPDFGETVSCSGSHADEPNKHESMTFDTPGREGEEPESGVTMTTLGDTCVDTPGDGIDEDVMVGNDLEVMVEGKVPDGGWGWFVVLGAFITHVLMGGMERSSGILYLQLLTYFKDSATKTSWVIAIFSTLRLFCGPLASALCNRFSIRTVVMLGTILCTVGVLVSGFSSSLEFLYFSYGFLGGLGRALTYAPSLIIVGYYFNKKRGLAVGLSTSGVGIGTFLFPPMMEMLFGYYGFQGTFLVLAACTSNFFVCGALFRPLELHQKIMRQKELKNKCNLSRDQATNKLLDMKTSKNLEHPNCESLRTDVKMSSTLDITANVKIESRRNSFFKRKYSQVKQSLLSSSKSAKSERKILDLSLFKNFAFSCLCIQLFLFTLSFNTTFTFLPALAKDYGIDQLQGAYLVSILGIFDGLSRICMSSLLDLKQVKPYRLIVYNVVMFIVAVVALVIPLMKTFWEFAVVSGLYGILSGLYISQKSVVCVDILGVEKLASSFGLLLSFQGVSSLVGPVVGGRLKDALGSYDMAFYVGSVGSFLGGITMAMGNVWLYRQKKLQGRENIKT